MAITRYIVDDVDQALEFYTEVLGFELTQRYGPPFASVSRGDQELWLSGPGTSARQEMPDGTAPAPGGWNRIVIAVEDIEVAVAELRRRQTVFRNEPLTGPGGTQVLVEDPSGNPIEVFEPA